MLVDAEWDEAILPLGYDAVIGTLKLPRTANHKPWTGVDMDWIGKAGKALNSAEQMFVAISLIRWASWKGYPVEADSEKTEEVNRKAVRQTLKLLEAAGLAKVEWHSSRPPIVLDLIGCPLPAQKKRATRH